MKATPILAFLSIVSLSLFATAEPTTDSKSLGFLAGTWRVTHGDTITEETWTDDAGGTMLGVGRTVEGGKTVFFEFLRIETRGSDVFYIAQPRGGAAVQFKLTSADGKTFVFENPQHDFPQKITYEKVSDDKVRASISGPRNGKQSAMSWEYQRVRKDSRLNP